MAKRDRWLTTEIGGMPVWGMLIAVALVISGGGWAVATSLSREASPQSTRTPWTPPPPDPIITIIGDSYTEGSGENTGPEWPALINIDADLQILACGGTGYVATNDEVCPGTTFVTNAAKITNDAEVVVFFGSRNDFGRDASAAFREAFNLSRERAPQAELIVVGPAWTSANVPESGLVYRDQLQAVAVEFGATWVDPLAEGWFFDNPELIGADGVHPTDEGHAYLAGLFQAILGS